MFFFSDLKMVCDVVQSTLMSWFNGCSINQCLELTSEKCYCGMMHGVRFMRKVVVVPFNIRILEEHGVGWIA